MYGSVPFLTDLELIQSACALHVEDGVGKGKGVEPAEDDARVDRQLSEALKEGSAGKGGPEEEGGRCGKLKT